MARLQTCSEDTLSSDTLERLAPTRIGGKIADVYLQFANSEHALAAYLTMEQSLRQSALTDAELEGIKLLVSEITGCDYCLSVHSMKAKRAGLSEAQQIKIRSGGSSDNEKLDTVLQIVRHFFSEREPISDQLLASARAHQISDATLIDIAMACSTIFFTNITNHINDTERTLPPAPQLP
jgi:AhpD family alkylhydroperoxidase